MKGTDHFKRTIQMYLEQRAEEDTLFAKKYRNPAKNIDECVTHILNYTVITYSVPLIPVKATGTGDIFTSVLSGAIMRGFTVHEAAQLAMNFTTKSIQATVDNVKSMKHGIAFELVLPELTNLSK